MPPDLDIGVIYTHERELMPRLLETMSASGEGLRMRLILVDNASADGVEPWRGYFAETQVLHNARRLSLRRQPEPHPRRLDRAVRAADEHRHVLRPARAMPGADASIHGQPAALRHGRLPAVSRRRLRRPRRPAVPDAAADAGAALRPGPMASRARSTATSTPNTRPDETWPCDWLSGCFLMVRREAIEEVGRFDEGYGKYFEDVDICLRMARAGWQVMYHGAASCYHLEQRASKNLLLGRRLAAPPRVPPLAPQMGFPPRIRIWSETSSHTRSDLGATPLRRGQTRQSRATPWGACRVWPLRGISRKSGKSLVSKSYPIPPPMTRTIRKLDHNRHCYHPSR